MRSWELVRNDLHLGKGLLKNSRQKKQQGAGKGRAETERTFIPNRNSETAHVAEV